MVEHIENLLIALLIVAIAVGLGFIPWWLI